jgi:hypothetical protein
VSRGGYAHTGESGRPWPVVFYGHVAWSDDTEKP